MAGLIYSLTIRLTSAHYCRCLCDSFLARRPRRRQHRPSVPSYRSEAAGPRRTSLPLMQLLTHTYTYTHHVHVNIGCCVPNARTLIRSLVPACSDVMCVCDVGCVISAEVEMEKARAKKLEDLNTQHQADLATRDAQLKALQEQLQRYVGLSRRMQEYNRKYTNICVFV